MTFAKLSRPLLIAGVALTALGIFIAWGLHRDIFGDSLHSLQTLPPIFLAALLLGTILTIAGCASMPTRLGPLSEMVLGVGLIATSFVLPRFLAVLGLPINVHLWTMSFFFPVVITFFTGWIFLARGWSKGGRKINRL
jgi:hypothetical protein